MATTTRCRSCNTEMIDHASYQRDPALRRIYARAVTKWAMCHPCVRRARKRGTLPDPPPPKTYGTHTRCRGCGDEMVSQQAYKTNQPLPDHVCVHDGHGLCKTCYGRARARGTLPNPASHAPRRRRGSADTFADRAGPNDPETVARLRASVRFEPPTGAAPARPGAAPYERHAKGEVTV